MSSAAEKIAGNDDLLLQILACLPIESLLKFKSVSKHWLSLITNPRFSRRGHSPALLLQTWSRNRHFEFDFNHLHCQHSQALSSFSPPPNLKIVRSCNGLLLCCDRSELAYSVCNPTTRQYVTIPPSPIQISCDLLAFDPLKSTEYKVICVLGREIEPDFRIRIYSSKSGEWRESEAKFSLDLDIMRYGGFYLYGGVYCNGGIHWYTDSGPCFYLDLDEEQVKEMPMPNLMPDGWLRRRVEYFGESRGLLHLVEFYHPPSSQFDVWELKSDYSGWFRKYRVDLEGLAGDYPGMIRDDIDPWEEDYYLFQILCIVEGEREEGSYMVLKIPGIIIRYDFKTRNVKKLCDFPPLGDHRNDEIAGNIEYGYSSCYQYIESLVRL